MDCKHQPTKNESIRKISAAGSAAEAVANALTAVTAKKTKNTKAELGAPSPLTTGQAIDQMNSIVNRLNLGDRQPVLEAMVLLNAPQGCSVKFEYCYRCDD